MSLWKALLVGLPALALACGTMEPSEGVEDLASDPVVLPAPEGSVDPLGRADGIGVTVIRSVRIAPEVGATETRRAFTTAASFQRFFGVAAPVDFGRRWVAFYSAGWKPTGGYTASIARVARSSSGRLLEVTTRLASPGEGCPVSQGRTKPAVLVSFAKPNGVGSVRYYRSDLKPAACSQPSLCGEDLKGALAAATDGLLWMSESDYPFQYFERPGAGARADVLTRAGFLALLGKPASTPVEVRTLADMLSFVTRDDPTMTPEERATAARYRKLRSLLEANLQGITVLKVGRIEIEVYFVGRTRCGDVAGLRTTAIET